MKKTETKVLNAIYNHTPPESKLSSLSVGSEISSDSSRESS